MNATTVPPRAQELSEGDLGRVLEYLERGDTSTAATLLAGAVAGGVSTGANASLFHGAPAVEFVLGRAGRPRPQVERAVDAVVAARLWAARRRQASAALALPAEWDLIRGLTGLGALLLARPAPSPLLGQVLSQLVRLAEPVPTPHGPLPGWWSPRGPHDEEHPGGHSNNGLAHGIAGPLALLSLALRQGQQVPGQQRAIAAFAHWLRTHGHRYWTLREHLAAPAPPPKGGRPSWCYGQAGIARALQLAALALDDASLQEQAEDTLERTLTDPAALGAITDASLCHGWAGLVVLTRAVAADSPTPHRFTPLLTDLTGRLAATADDLPKPGFLEGRSGARLALHGTDTTAWTRALLLT
ncbi:lanthionine synthetase C family protein [Nocardiopsis terrae]|uniref:lanthionine synthetase C family protein n=1 Tax=Streptomyces sp. NPDC057554 TaxID=3350538 RepID=UPI0036BEEF3B